jgi:hypothetical protein
MNGALGGCRHPEQRRIVTKLLSALNVRLPLVSHDALISTLHSSGKSKAIRAKTASEWDIIEPARKRTASTCSGDYRRVKETETAITPFAATAGCSGTRLEV